MRLSSTLVEIAAGSLVYLVRGLVGIVAFLVAAMVLMAVIKPGYLGLLEAWVFPFVPSDARGAENFAMILGLALFLAIWALVGRGKRR